MAWMNQKSKDEFYKDSYRLIQKLKNGQKNKDYRMMDTYDTGFYRVLLYQVYCEELESYVAVLKSIYVYEPVLVGYSVVSDWQTRMPQTIQEAKEREFIELPNLKEENK